MIESGGSIDELPGSVEGLVLAQIDRLPARDRTRLRLPLRPGHELRRGAGGPAARGGGTGGRPRRLARAGKVPRPRGTGRSALPQRADPRRGLREPAVPPSPRAACAGRCDDRAGRGSRRRRRGRAPGVPLPALRRRGQGLAVRAHRGGARDGALCERRSPRLLPAGARGGAPAARRGPGRAGLCGRGARRRAHASGRVRRCRRRVSDRATQARDGAGRRRHACWRRRPGRPIVRDGTRWRCGR